MSRFYMSAALVVTLAWAALVPAQTSNPALAPPESRIGKVIEVTEPGKSAEQCVIVNAWRMADGTAAMQVKSQQTGELITIVEGPSGLRDRFRLFRWGRTRTPPPGTPLPPVTVVATPVPTKPAVLAAKPLPTPGASTRTIQKPATSDLGPVLSKPAPAKEVATAPVIQKPAPLTTTPAPVIQKPTPVTTTPAPVIQKPAPVATAPQPLAVPSKPVPAKEVASAPTPTVQKPTPVTTTPAPVIQKPAPVATPPKPLTVPSKPVPAKEVASAPTPTVQKPAPLAVTPAPVMQKPVPVTTTPQPALMPSKPAPAKVAAPAPVIQKPAPVTTTAQANVPSPTPSRLTLPPAVPSPQTQAPTPTTSPSPARSQAKPTVASKPAMTQPEQKAPAFLPDLSKPAPAAQVAQAPTTAPSPPAKTSDKPTAQLQGTPLRSAEQDKKPGVLSKLFHHESDKPEAPPAQQATKPAASSPAAPSWTAAKQESRPPVVAKPVPAKVPATTTAQLAGESATLPPANEQTPRVPAYTRITSKPIGTSGALAQNNVSPPAPEGTAPSKMPAPATTAANKMEQQPGLMARVREHISKPEEQPQEKPAPTQEKPAPTAEAPAKQPDTFMGFQRVPLREQPRVKTDTKPIPNTLPETVTKAPDAGSKEPLPPKPSVPQVASKPSAADANPSLAATKPSVPQSTVIPAFESEDPSFHGGEVVSKTMPALPAVADATPPKLPSPPAAAVKAPAKEIARPTTLSEPTTTAADKAKTPETTASAAKNDKSTLWDLFDRKNSEVASSDSSRAGRPDPLMNPEQYVRDRDKNETIVPARASDSSASPSTETAPKVAEAKTDTTPAPAAPSVKIESPVPVAAAADSSPLQRPTPPRANIVEAVSVPQAPPVPPSIPEAVKPATPQVVQMPNPITVPENAAAKTPGVSPVRMEPIPCTPPPVPFNPMGPGRPVQPIQQVSLAPGAPMMSQADMAAMQNTAYLMHVLQNSTVPAQREWAANRLRVIDPRNNPFVVESLLNAARYDSAPLVRVSAIQSLSAMAICTRPVMATLEAATRDQDPRVQEQAMQALGLMSLAQCVTPGVP